MRHAFAIGLIALLACSTGPLEPGGSPENARHTASAIINGAPDTKHDAVVALIIGSIDQPEGFCSGTIFKVDAASRVGWVATAAHCVNDVPVTYISIGKDYYDPGNVLYPVIDSGFDSLFDETALDSGHDFGILRFAGATASTPFIPLATVPDGLVAGASVDSVGYGQTNKPSQADTGNTARNFLTKPLATVGDLVLTYSGQDSGGCFGDSGGPLIAGDGATARIVGIHSYESGDCDGEFGSGRVSAALTFYSTQLAKPLPPPDCTQCRIFADAPGGKCAARYDACQADTNCGGYWDCYAGGGTADECAKKWPLGEGPYAQAYYCPCTEACVEECKTDPTAATTEEQFCAAHPKCGFDGGDSCSTCIEGSCCAEETACAKDAECFSCIRADKSCGTNEAHAKLIACETAHCDAECSPPKPEAPVDAGASSSSSSSSGAPAPAALPIDAGTPAAAPAPTKDDGGCNTSGRPTSSSVFCWLAVAFAVSRLRPYRSSRR